MPGRRWRWLAEQRATVRRSRPGARQRAAASAPARAHRRRARAATARAPALAAHCGRAASGRSTCARARLAASRLGSLLARRARRSRPRRLAATARRGPPRRRRRRVRRSPWRDADGALHLARDAIGERTLFYAQVAATASSSPRRSARCSRPASSRARSTCAAVAALPRLRLRSRTRDARRRASNEAAARRDRRALPAGSDAARHASLVAVPAEAAAPRRGRRATRCVARLAARACERPCARRSTATDEAGGRVPVRRHRLEPRRGARAARCIDAPRPHVLGVVRRRTMPTSSPGARWSRRTAGREHRVVELTPDAVLANISTTRSALLSDPIGDPLTVPNALLFREAARDVGVVLNGEGGDPCFGGPKNLPMLLAELLRRRRRTARRRRYARERSYLRAHLKMLRRPAAILLAADVRAALGRGPAGGAADGQFRGPDLDELRDSPDGAEHHFEGRASDPAKGRRPERGLRRARTLTALRPAGCRDRVRHAA